MILIHQIRKYAIHKLSTDFVLSPIEKIHLSRAHKVATWLTEGVTSLVNDPEPTFDVFATLGWETAARILWIRDHSSRPQSLMSSNTLYFKRGDINCGNCWSSSSFINFQYNCSSCGEVVPADEELSTPGPGTVSGSIAHTVLWRKIQHINCGGAIFSSPFSPPCQGCSGYFASSDSIRVTPTSPKEGLKGMIEEVFGEEIRNYEVG